MRIWNNTGESTAYTLPVPNMYCHNSNSPPVQFSDSRSSAAQNTFRLHGRRIIQSTVWYLYWLVSLPLIDPLRKFLTPTTRERAQELRITSSTEVWMVTICWVCSLRTVWSGFSPTEAPLAGEIRVSLLLRSQCSHLVLQQCNPDIPSMGIKVG